ncbi:MAG: helix-hairpin-helix domain-containing protein [Ruminococcus sp.]|nr:helix-hairpin-helix domain-containing protein [Ruminococcus sp.]
MIKCPFCFFSEITAFVVLIVKNLDILYNQFRRRFIKGGVLVQKIYEFFKSEKAIIVVAFVFVLIIIGYSVYDVALDKTDRYAYEKEKIESLQVELVNINKADVETLCELPGVGESTASEIIKYRTENGKFESTEEIQEVKGIGFQDYIKIAPLITV